MKTLLNGDVPDSVFVESLHADIVRQETDIRHLLQMLHEAMKDA